MAFLIYFFILFLMSLDLLVAFTFGSPSPLLPHASLVERWEKGRVVKEINRVKTKR